MISSKSLNLLQTLKNQQGTTFTYLARPTLFPNFPRPLKPAFHRRTTATINVKNPQEFP
jgi:hypothetical protein